MPPESTSTTDTGAGAGNDPGTAVAGNGSSGPGGADRSPAATGPTLDVEPLTPTPTTAAPEETTAGRPGIRGWFLFRSLLVYVICRVVLLVLLPIVDLFTHKGLGHDLGVWDAKWFLRAAEQGWPRHLPMIHGHVAGNTIAFFPLFPLLIRWGHDLTGLSPLGVGVAISGITGFTAVIGVGLLVRRFAGEEKAARATLLFVVFPGTFVFSLVYSEGIVITCVAFGLLALLDRRWWLAGLLGLLASATSPIALAFAVSCAWCAGVELVRHRNWRALIAPVLAPLGFVAYMVWLWRHTGVLNAWRLTERGGWNSFPSALYPVHIVTTFVTDPVAPTRTGQLLFFGTLVAVIGAVLAVKQKQPPPVLLYGCTALVLAAVSAPVGLRPRFIMLAFPLVIAYGTRLRGRAYAWAMAISVVCLVVMTLTTLASSAVFP
jgi:hypothetical protein